MVDILKLIAAISPDTYCDPSVRKEIKNLVKEKGYLVAAESGKIKVIGQKEFIMEDAKMKPLSLYGLKSPLETHKLTYDTMTESLEPIYFWILDLISKLYRDGVDKITDNFVAAPGSGFFSELGQKATAMQEKAMSLLGTVNTVLKSILNIIYDMKEFRIRLGLYDKYHSKNPQEKRESLYSLKQIWMDNVDIKRGTTSIKGLIQQFDYVTIIDAFMASENSSKIKDLDLNDRVKRILEQRLGEFEQWLEESERELRKRYEIEKRYLQSQYNMIQLYSKWIAPYLKAANKLEQNARSTAALVHTFNTMLLELSLLARTAYDPADDVATGALPRSFAELKKRKYYSILLIDFNFRGLPQRVSQGGYSYGGKTDVTFTGLSLNNEEIDLLKKEIEKSTFGDVLGLIEGGTKESLEQIRDDIDDLLKEKKEKKEEKIEDENPFTALFSFLKKEKKEEKSDLSKGIKSDDSYEKVIRSMAIIDAIDKCRTVFDTYKKAHQMPAFP